MKLDLFGKIDGLSEDDLHPKFKLLRDNVFLGGERSILTDWTEYFVDRDNKIIKEFQTTFHSSFWEFYLFQVFKNLNFEIDFSRDRPDFIINSPEKFYVEAVVSNIKKDGRKELTRNVNDFSSMIIPPHKQKDFYDVLDEAIIRNSNAILGKSSKYLEKYLKCDWVDKQSPFIIALSGYNQVNYGRQYIYSIIALLYGFYFNPKSNTYEVKHSLLKPGTDSTIPLGLFNNNSYQHISAVIFSCTVTLGKLTSLSISKGNTQPQMNAVVNIRHDLDDGSYKIQQVSSKNPEYLGDGLYICHNPNAKSKLDSALFHKSKAIEIIIEDGQLVFIEENLPIYSRLNHSKFIIHDDFIRSISHDFNS